MTDGQAEVLVVDDDDAVRKAVTRTLKSAGFAVVGSSSADDALEVLRAGRRFDVIITDLLMPGTSGTEFVRLVREFDVNVPVIVLTGHSSVDSAILVLERGGFRYLQKPVASRTLVSAVREASEMHRPARLAVADLGMASGLR